MSDTIVNSLMEVIPYIKYIMKEDVALSIVDKATHKYIFIDQADKFQLKVKVGDSVQEDSPSIQALNEGKSFARIVPTEVFGIPVLGGIYPIKDSDGEVVCAVAFAKSVEAQYKIEAASDTIFSSLQQTNASVEEIASNSQNLVSSMNHVTSSTNNMNEKIKEIDTLLKAIENIASQSNLLSLNAAIEAARAGEAGKGFSVVANEVKKLSTISKESAANISKTLVEIKESMDEIINEIQSTSGIAESQSAVTEEITATIEEITASSQVLAEMAKID